MDRVDVRIMYKIEYFYNFNYTNIITMSEEIQIPNQNMRVCEQTQSVSDTARFIVFVSKIDDVRIVLLRQP